MKTYVVKVKEAKLNNPEKLDAQIKNYKLRKFNNEAVVFMRCGLDGLDIVNGLVSIVFLTSNYEN